MSENHKYARCALFIGDKKTLSDESLHDLAAEVDDDEADSNSTSDDFRLKMLCNFLELAVAVETIGLLELTETEIERAELALERYMTGLKSLYKEAKIQTNHHLALHLGIFIRLFGPVHSWRAFIFERMNYVLQTTKSSNIFGQYPRFVICAALLNCN